MVQFPDQNHVRREKGDQPAEIKRPEPGRLVIKRRRRKILQMHARPTFPDELELHRIDCLSCHGNLENYDFLKAKAAELPPEVVKPVPLLTGHDLLALGFKPGPWVGQVLREVEELQLEERLSSPAAALAYARQRQAELRNAAPGSAPSAPPGNG